MRVVVDPPAIHGDTVSFSWTQSEPNPFQRANTFYLRYEEIEVAQFSTTFFLELFLGLQLKVYAASSGPVEIVFPAAVPQSTAAFWRAYHDADNVSITPISNATSYSPWAADRPPPLNQRRVGVFFGGGKDSTLATCLLSELYGREEVVLFQFVAPNKPGAKRATKAERRQEALMLRPARERLGVATQRAWTNYHAQQTRYDGPTRPHLELYTVGLLPALLAWGVSICTTSLAWNHFPIRRQDDGRYWFDYVQSRPEMLATQSAHYRSALGSVLALTNVTLLFSSLSAFKLLSLRYPDALRQIIMCGRADAEGRWCYQCQKCANYAFFGLYCGFVDPRFDYNRFITTSRYIRGLVDYLEGGVELTPLGNAPFHSDLGWPAIHLMECHALAHLSPRIVRHRLTADAYADLVLLQSAFGNRSYPVYEYVPAKAIDLLANDAARNIAHIAAQYFDVVDDLPGPFDELSTEYDFGQIMPTRTGLLPHIRAQT